MFMDIKSLEWYIEMELLNEDDYDEEKVDAYKSLASYIIGINNILYIYYISHSIL